MKFFKGVVSATLLGALFLAAPALRADSKKDHGHGHWDRFELLKKKLDLSDGQVSEWKAAQKEQRESAKLLRDKVKADEAGLAVLVDEKASDDDLKASLDTLDADHKALAENGQKLIERLRQILNPLQQAKAALMLGHRGHGHGRRGGFGMACGPQGKWGGPHPGWKGGPNGWHGQGGGPGHWKHPHHDGGADQGGPGDAAGGD